MPRNNGKDHIHVEVRMNSRLLEGLFINFTHQHIEEDTKTR